MPIPERPRHEINTVTVGNYRNVGYAVLAAVRTRYGNSHVDEESFLAAAESMPDDLNGPYVTMVITSRPELDLLLAAHEFVLHESSSGTIYLSKLVKPR